MTAEFIDLENAAKYTSILTREGIGFRMYYDIVIEKWIVRHTGGY